MNKKEKPKTIIVNGTVYKFIHIKKNINSFIMKVRNGQILVSTPFNYDAALLEQFISKRIVKKANHLENRYDTYTFQKNNVKIYLFGQKLDHENGINYIQERERKKIYLRIVNEYDAQTLLEQCEQDISLTIKVPVKTSDENIIKILYKRFLEKYYNLYLNEMNFIAKKYGVKIKKMHFRNLLGAWGLCKSVIGEIVLSKNLIHYPYVIQHYVMVHEIAHLVEPNHTKRFWKVVEQQCPNYQILRRKLRW